MLTINDFLTNHENLVNLLSVATYGNEWPVVKAFKSDDDKGLFEGCEYREDKWARGLMQGKGIMVYDLYDDDVEEDGFLLDIKDFPKSAKHHLTLADIQRGLETLRDKYPRHWADLVEENDDLYTGDAFLQCAVFGELVYG